MSIMLYGVLFNFIILKGYQNKEMNEIHTEFCKQIFQER